MTATCRLRDFAALAIFLFTLLQNLGTYWKETNKHHVHVHHLSSSSPLSSPFLEQDQKYSSLYGKNSEHHLLPQQQQQQRATSAAANEYSDSSRRIAATAATTKNVVYNNHTTISTTATTTTTATTAAYYNETTETTPTIRRWGCDLHQTPLIYIHIGKAGGGMVRARFAASALEFGANQIWRDVGQAYYPVRVVVDVIGKKDGTTTGSNGDTLERGDNSGDDNEPRQTTGITDGNGHSFTYKKGYFCNSGQPNFRSHGKRSFEGTQFCHATTPLGQAVACPVPLLNLHSISRNSTAPTNGITAPTNGISITTHTKKEISGACRKACHFLSDSCHVVYVGHNLLGSEMHWLPQGYLSNWWKNDYLKSYPPIYNNVEKQEQESELKQSDYDEQDYDKIQAYLQTLAPGDLSWCPYVNKSRPVLADDYVQEYAQCSVALGQVVDKEAFLTVRGRHYHPAPTSSGSVSSSSAVRQLLLPQHPLDYIDWSHIYASMPVLRTTIIRDPFSWLVSKFFWHSDPLDGGVDDDNDNGVRHVLKCDDVEMATMPVSPFTVDDKVAQQGGWANRYALNYIVYLCGEDCASRYHQGIGNLQQMERQAANNLRHSFAVVGLLEETDTFYDMVTKRVQYVNMSRHSYGNDVRGAALHSSGNGPEQLRCKEKFADASFQALLKEKSPIIAAVDRLYQVGVQVNRFQLEELQSCHPPPPTTTTTTTTTTTNA